MKARRDKLDIVFSKCIRAAANWTCECCGKQVPDFKRQSLHASHYMSRRHQATRFDPNNVFAHCFTCHQRLGENPSEFYRWYCERMGEGMEQMIREKAHSIKKRKPTEKEAMYSHFKHELQRIEQERVNGNDSKLQVIGWD